MDIHAEKLDLVQTILNIEDISLIKDIQMLIQTHDHDWFDDLTENQQQSILRGIKQLDNGEGISHEEAMARLGL